jgi:hypothetical protein
MVQPKLPRDISPYARACLEAIASKDLGAYVSLGGAFGLAHYIEYRSTNDVDAWWREPVPGEARDAVIRSVEEALRGFGGVRKRSWGDVTSVELEREGKTIFSFQIARRSAHVDEPMVGAWPGGIGIDSLDELIAGKMKALVERGAPRDFRDIYTICQAQYADVEHCWDLWTLRQRLSHEDTDRERAHIAIRSHLARLEAVRPLESIPDVEPRTRAARLRSWFEKEFLHEPSG